MRCAEIIDDDAGASRAEEGAVGFTQTAARSGDDDDLAVEAQLAGHGVGAWLVLKRQQKGAQTKGAASIVVGNKQTEGIREVELR